MRHFNLSTARCSDILIWSRSKCPVDQSDFLVGTSCCMIVVHTLHSFAAEKKERINKQIGKYKKKMKTLSNYVMCFKPNKNIFLWDCIQIIMFLVWVHLVLSVLRWCHKIEKKKKKNCGSCCFNGWWLDWMYYRFMVCPDIHCFI